MHITFIHKSLTWSPKGIHGGAENAVFNVATVLSALDNRVTVLGRFPESTEYRGVDYINVGPPYNASRILKRLPADTDVAVVVSDLDNALALRGAHPCKRVLWLHDSKPLDPISADDLDLVIFVSEAQRAFYERWYVTKSTVVYNGFDPDIFFVEPARVENRIVYAGALVDEKGIGLLVDAFELARQSAPQFTLHVFGSEDFWLRPSQDALENQREGIHLGGKVSHERLRQEYNRALLSVVPSSAKLRLEPFPCSAIESQACGCPTLVSDCGGLPEAVADPSLVFASDSVDALASALLDSVQNRERTLALRERCVAQVNPDHRWDRLAKRFLEALEEA